MSTQSLHAVISPNAAPARRSERIVKPWGEELILARSPGATTKLLRIRPGDRLSLQYHRQKDETLFLLGGDVELTIGPRLEHLRVLRLRPGDRVRIPAGAIHRLAALGETYAELLEVASHPPGQAIAPDDDIVRLADDFGRS